MKILFHLNTVYLASFVMIAKNDQIEIIVNFTNI